MCLVWFGLIKTQTTKDKAFKNQSCVVYRFTWEFSCHRPRLAPSRVVAVSGHAGGLDKAIKVLIERIERTGTLVSPKTRVNTAKRDEVARSEHSSSSNTFDRYTAVSVSIWTIFGEMILNYIFIGYNAALRDKSERNFLEFSCLYFYDLFLNFYPRTREPSNHAIMQCLGALAESRRFVGF